MLCVVKYQVSSILILFVLNALLAVSSYSQDDNTLFTYLEQPPEMDSTALNTFNKIVADTTIENHFFVTVNPIESVAVEKAIPILLPSHPHL